MGFFYLKKISYLCGMISEKLKQVIFKELYYQLGKVEIIPYGDSIFFINRENKYWYFEFEKCGRLWWRYDFFNDFFKIFSLEVQDYTKIISKWVEEVLNCKVSITGKAFDLAIPSVEEVLNYKVSTTYKSSLCLYEEVEEVLNFKVSTIHKAVGQLPGMVDEVLNHKVSTTIHRTIDDTLLVEEVLNYKVLTTRKSIRTTSQGMEEILSHTNK